MKRVQKYDGNKNDGGFLIELSGRAVFLSFSTVFSLDPQKEKLFIF